MKFFNCGNFGIDGNYTCLPTIVGTIVVAFVFSFILTFIIGYLIPKISERRIQNGIK